MSMKWQCSTCYEYRKLSVEWEQETGDFGQVLSSWPVFTLEPPCSGVVAYKEGELEQEDFADKVPEDKWLYASPHCPFDGQDDYGPEVGNAAQFAKIDAALDRLKGDE